MVIKPPAAFLTIEPKPAAPAVHGPLADVGAFILALDAHDDACVARIDGTRRWVADQARGGGDGH